MTRGITPPPLNIDPALRAHLMDMYQTVLQLRGAQEPPRVVPNFTATPLPGGNLLQWTTTDADSYQILWAESPDIRKAQLAFSGFGNSYQDVFGAGGVTRYYWIHSVKANGQKTAIPAGPMSSMSGAVGTAVTTPANPQTGDQLVLNTNYEYPVPRGPIRIGG